MKAIHHAIRLWRDRLRGSRLVLYCDNNAYIYGLKKSSINGQAMAPLREIALSLARNDILLVPTWIPTRANQLADALSRFQFKKLADTWPQLRPLAIAPQATGETHQNTGMLRPLCHEKQPVYSGGA